MLCSCYYAFSSQCDLVQDVTMDLIFLCYIISRKHFAITCVAGFSKFTTGKKTDGAMIGERDERTSTLSENQMFSGYLLVLFAL